MVLRNFYKFEEALKELACDDESMRQGIISRCLCPYIELVGGEVNYAMSDINGNFPKSGKSEIASLIDPQTWSATINEGWNYRLLGWFKLQENYADEICRSANVKRLLWILAENEDSSSPPAKFQIDMTLSLSDFWFRAAEIDSLKEKNKSVIESRKTKDTPLENREKNNLLRVIAALAIESKINIDIGKGGAEAIERACELSSYGGPKADTIRKILSQIKKLEQS